MADWMALTRHAPYLAHTKKRRNISLQRFDLISEG
jgi:hypothetical protein